MAGIDPKFYYLTAGLLAVCTVVGLIVAFRFQREVEEDLAPPTEKDLFDPLERAYYSGLMRDDEFQRIQESMAKQKGGKPVVPPIRRAKPPSVKASDGTPFLLPDSGVGGSGEGHPPITPSGDFDPGPSPG